MVDAAPDLHNTVEYRRLVDNQARRAYWKRWGPYLSDRQWGTVREDTSANGSVWGHFSHDQARSRAYRWGEDGILGISETSQNLCFAITVWNGCDPILKERYFGFTGRDSDGPSTGNEGSHGEDVKEAYFYLDSTPSHSYMRGLYKYPLQSYPYSALLQGNGQRSLHEPEYELIDTGIFDGGHYVDVEVEYAKAAPEDLAIRIHLHNRSPDHVGTVHLLPTLWFRNTWSWSLPARPRPSLQWQHQITDQCQIRAEFNDPDLVEEWGFQPIYTLLADRPDAVLVTNNTTNKERFGWGANEEPYVKDAFHEHLVHGRTGVLNPHGQGTKAAPHYRIQLQPGERRTVRLRLVGHAAGSEPSTGLGSALDALVEQRRHEADAFYAAITPLDQLSVDQQAIQRQAFAGLLWSKQFYHLVVQDWLHANDSRDDNARRNKDWIHLYNEDIISMPDKWEYPWYAAWDLAFHVIPLALVDPDFAKQQLRLFTREWFMHPNGQIPAYEWNFSDVNPPVHAWACLRVYQIEQRKHGRRDIGFLEEVFHRLGLTFAWWVNRKDADGDHLFAGGFLGLDNIGVFDRSAFKICNERGECSDLVQADATSWMAMFCLNMLRIATELARTCGEDETERRARFNAMASKYLQHFLLIADAFNSMGGSTSVYDEAEGFYFDVLRLPSGVMVDSDDCCDLPIRVRSMVGLVPLFAIEAIPADLLASLEDEFGKRLRWFRCHRPDLTQHANISLNDDQLSERYRGGLALALVSPERLRRLLQRVLDEDEFLSPHGIRSLSKAHSQPYRLPVQLRQDGDRGVRRNGNPDDELCYAPAESRTLMFGGNSNWRGPVWFPVNYLLIESLQKYHEYLGADFTVEFPTGSGRRLNLWQVADALSQRLIGLFEQQPGADGLPRRPFHGHCPRVQNDPQWSDHLLFHEYFDGDDGTGLGASHQTGWTGLVAKLLEQRARRAEIGLAP